MECFLNHVAVNWSPLQSGSSGHRSKVDHGSKIIIVAEERLDVTLNSKEQVHIILNRRMGIAGDITMLF